MGIRGIETALRNCPNGIQRVKVPGIDSEQLEKVIVVDGNQFYECYLYRQFDWLHVGLRNLVKEIKTFVDSFRLKGVHLVFVFRHSGPPDPMKRAGWIKNREKNIEFNNEILHLLKINKDIPEERKFGDRLEHVKYFVIQILRSMDCEVHCEIRKHGTTAMIEHALRTNALCILSQNSYLLFYHRVPRYLSIKHLDLVKMETEEYRIDALSEYLQLRRNFFPLYATILGDNELVKTDHPFQRARNNIRDIICRSLRGPSDLIVARYIRSHWRHNDARDFLRDVFEEDGETLVPAYEEFDSQFTRGGEEEGNVLFPVIPPNIDPEIVRRVEEMVVRGEMYSKIHHIIVRNVFEQYIIPEDYETLPSSGLVFRSLRKKMYGILFRYTSESEIIEIEEWYMDDGECRSFQEIPDPIQEELHPGLLTLWNSNSDEVNIMKWNIFSQAISPNMDLALLEQLPPNLIVPTVVLLYLVNEIPRCSLESNYDILQSWEIEAFIATLVLFRSMNVEDSLCGSVEEERSMNVKDSLCGSVEEEKSCARSVMLCAFFVSGCFYMNMLVQVCGYPVTENNMQIFKYFDGFLFHYLYREVKNRGVGHLIPIDAREDFLRIKRILNLPD